MPNDWLSSTHILLMDPAGEGGYFRILCHSWNDPDCSLPSDDETLAVLSRLVSAWPSHAPKIRACFVAHPDRPGRIINRKLLSVRCEQQGRLAVASGRGSKGAQQRGFGVSEKARAAQSEYERLQRLLKRVDAQALPEQSLASAQALPEQSEVLKQSSTSALNSSPLTQEHTNGDFRAPTLPEIMAWPEAQGVDEATLKLFCAHNEAAGWRMDNGRHWDNLPALLTAWIERAKQRAERPRSVYELKQQLLELDAEILKFQKQTFKPDATSHPQIRPEALVEIRRLKALVEQVKKAIREGGATVGPTQATAPVLGTNGASPNRTCLQ